MNQKITIPLTNNIVIFIMTGIIYLLYNFLKKKLNLFFLSLLGTVVIIAEKIKIDN